MTKSNWEGLGPGGDTVTVTLEQVETLYEETVGAMRRYVGGRVPPEEVEDIVNVVFTRLVERYRHVVHPEALKAYAYMMLRSEISTYHRRRAARERLQEQAEQLAVLEDNVAWDDEELAAYFKVLVRRLPLRERLVIGMIFYEGVHPEKVAEVLDISRNYVYVIRGRALKRLRAWLTTPYSSRGRPS